MELLTYSFTIYSYNFYEFTSIYPDAVYNDRESNHKYSKMILEKCDVVSVTLICQKMGICLLESTLIP